MQTGVYPRKSAVCAILLSLALTLALAACSQGGGSDSGADGGQTVKSGESLVIPVGELSETAGFYRVTVDGTGMGVVAVKTPDGKIRTAFDTCQVCNGAPGAYFEQNGTTLQCQNCGNRFPMERVEAEAGGCNPIPIFENDKTVTDEAVTISYETLKANKGLFSASWRK